MYFRMKHQMGLIRIIYVLNRKYHSFYYLCSRFRSQLQEKVAQIVNQCA